MWGIVCPCLAPVPTKTAVNGLCMSAKANAAVPFRTLQTVHDLRGVAEAAGKMTRARIAAGAGNNATQTDLDALIYEDQCRIGRAATQVLHQSLILAATLPNDDFEAFQAATAILLADRLQHGNGQDDLFWHWDAFHEHYALAAPWVRSSLMRGFGLCHAEGLVSLNGPPRLNQMITEPREAIMKQLNDITGPPHQSAATALLLALETVEASEEMWADVCAPVLAMGQDAPTLLVRPVRHLFESLPDWDPFDGRTFDLAQTWPELIPPVIE